MNNPFYYPPNFRRLSELNRERDLSDIFPVNSAFENNLDPFPTKIFVINLEEREDRWEGFKSSNSQLFEKFEVVRFNATKLIDVQEAIFQSFFKCVRSQTDETFIVMEDDTYLADGAIDQLEKSWGSIPRDWDVVFGNHYFFSKLQIINDFIAQPIGRASTANFGIYSKRLVDKLSDLSLREDAGLSEWDHFLTGNPQINNFLYWPMISREHPGYSDHRGKIMDINLRTREHRYRYNFIDNEKFYERIWKT